MCASNFIVIWCICQVQCVHPLLQVPTAIPNLSSGPLPSSFVSLSSSAFSSPLYQADHDQ